MRRQSEQNGKHFRSNAIVNPFRSELMFSVQLSWLAQKLTEMIRMVDICNDFKCVTSTFGFRRARSDTFRSKTHNNKTGQYWHYRNKITFRFIWHHFRCGRRRRPHSGIAFVCQCILFEPLISGALFVSWCAEPRQWHPRRTCPIDCCIIGKIAEGAKSHTSSAGDAWHVHGGQPTQFDRINARLTQLARQYIVYCIVSIVCEGVNIFSELVALMRVLAEREPKEWGKNPKKLWTFELTIPHNSPKITI